MKNPLKLPPTKSKLKCISTELKIWFFYMLKKRATLSHNIKYDTVQ